MSRSTHFRFAALLLAVVHLALPGGAWGVRTCAHHDAIQPDAAAGTGHDAAHHAAHGVQVAPDGEAPADDHGPCSCLDACAAAGAIAVAATPVVGVAEDVSGAVSDDVPAASVPHVIRPPFFLPLPHAPPV